MRTAVIVVSLFSVLLSGTKALCNQSNLRIVHIGDVTTVEGVRDNPLVGYGIVVGLNGTGDRQQTIFSMQTIANVLRKFGVQAPGATLITRNIASVFVTATLPPFARPGTRMDANVSSIGDAKSLEGGTLLLTSLYAPDGQVYAVVQGPIVLGGYVGGARGNMVQVNHPTAGRIPSGSIVERDASLDLGSLSKISFLLRDPDFITAQNAAAAINSNLGNAMASALDGRRIEIALPPTGSEARVQLLARIEGISFPIHARAKVVVNERTGTVVMGKEVSLGACSILHGNLAIEITTEFRVSQPAPFSTGQTTVVPETTVKTQESPARRLELGEGATVDDLVNGLQAIGATARDIVAILEAIKADGAMEAELEVI